MTTSLSDELQRLINRQSHMVPTDPAYDPELAAVLRKAVVALRSADDWRIELNEVYPTFEDEDRTLLESRIVLRPQPGHFDFKIRYKGQLVFFMTSSPRPIDDPEVPCGELHVYMHAVEGNKMPLRHLLDRANRIS